METIIILKTDGTKTVKTVESIELAFLQESVGGYIEAVELPSYGATMYVNEDGKSKGLMFNTPATELFQGDYGKTDVIVGDVVLVGFTDAKGNDTGLTDDQIQSFLLDLPH
jgi:hypothetical protein